MLGDRLLTTPNGYALAAEPSEVDALTFEALVAAGDLAAALDLWRGEPYAGVPDAPDVLAARTRLTEIRLATLEDRLEADLALGRHAHLVAELAALVADHPTRQRLACPRLLALYRCGPRHRRPAELPGAADRLAGEYAIEPGDELAALARAIERRDPTLGRTRLLTLTGPGGAGKTRLAFELARDTEADHRDGVRAAAVVDDTAGQSLGEGRGTAALTGL